MGKMRWETSEAVNYLLSRARHMGCTMEQAAKAFKAITEATYLFPSSKSLKKALNQTKEDQ